MPVSKEPFEFRDGPAVCTDEGVDVQIADLYKSRTGAVDFELKNCAVIYRHEDNAVIKQKNGRAVYVYKEARQLETGRMYDISVSRLKRYRGNLEITGIESVRKKKEINDPDPYYIEDPDADLSDPALENEVTGVYSGVYKDKGFFYGKGRWIRLYFRDKSLAPAPGSRIRIRHARIGYHGSPEIVIEKPEQVKKLESRN